MYLTILIPCLNEERTIGECINKAKKFINRTKIDADILVVDNNSTDNSINIAKEHGARVVIEHSKGYGNALRTGIRQAEGEYIIFGDADCSYDFEHLDEYISKFKEGYEFVTGNRFAYKIDKSAMSRLHKIGVPFLSWIGRCRYKVKIKDFHCGLRGFKKCIFMEEDLKTSGMEFATEMIAVAARKKVKIGEIPIKLYPDKRGRSSHLRTIRDGFRHLIYMMKGNKET